MFDYEAFRVAVHHLLDNAAKYAMPDSNIEISFRKEKDFFVSQFNMMSMEILPDEITKINSEGYSGHFPKKAKKNGQGIGMGIINKMLPLNGAKPVVLPNVDKSKEISLNGIQFRNNIFEIHFQNKWLA
jgi:K+-sensing histidine kinase KdpD